MRGRSRQLSVAAGLGVLCFLLSACAAPRPDAIEYETAPADFTLDITIQGPSLPDQPRAERPSRYIVEPDGTLRVGVGKGVSVDYFPPQTRLLTRPELDRLWRLVRDSAVLLPHNPDEARPGLAFSSVYVRPTADLTILFAGSQTSYRVILDGQTPSAAATERIVDHLAELAWLEP